MEKIKTCIVLLALMCGMTLLWWNNITEKDSIILLNLEDKVSVKSERRELAKVEVTTQKRELAKVEVTTRKRELSKVELTTQTRELTKVELTTQTRELAKVELITQTRELTKVELTTQKAELTTQSNADKYHNWIILMTVNTAFIDFFQNWFWYFQIHQVTVPVIVIAEDENCFKKLNELYNNTRPSVTIERSDSDNTESAADFNTKQFNQLVGKRPAHILKKLQLGKNVLYCDTDSVWLRNPFPHLVGEFDIWAQMDKNKYCTGFLSIKCNNRTLQLVEKWKQYMVNNTSIEDQNGFNQQDKTSVRIKGLDTDLFPSGVLYFRKLNDTKYSNVVVVHNNWIVGHDRKIERFKKFNLWH